MCLEKILWEKRANLPGNSLAVLPTGSGKSVIIASLANALNEPILVLQPSKEILEQNYEKLARYVPQSDIGIYSASMNRKDTGYYTLATIQSIYKDPQFFQQFRTVFLDEAHLLNPKSLGGMFNTFLRDIGNPKVIGFTATPYRLDSMYMNWGTDQCRIVTAVKLINRMKGFFWQRIIYNMSMMDLMAKGYLCPPTYIDASVIEQYEIPLNFSKSEFDMDAFDQLMSSRQEKILRAIKYGEDTSKSVLVFCSSVHQATTMAGLVPGSAVVTAKTPAKERDRIIGDFKEHRLKTVFNVGVLTTGFDHPALDCIILLRPTRSITLYVQMLGRGVRIAEGKETCKIIDLTSSVKNLGRVETISVGKGDDGKWDIFSETGTWHARELYSFVIDKPIRLPKIEDEK